MDGDTIIVQAADVPLAGIPGGTLKRPFNWWLSAIYAHILATEHVVQSPADAVAGLDATPDK